MRYLQQLNFESMQLYSLKLLPVYPYPRLISNEKFRENSNFATTARASTTLGQKPIIRNRNYKHHCNSILGATGQIPSPSFPLPLDLKIQTQACMGEVWTKYGRSMGEVCTKYGRSMRPYFVHTMLRYVVMLRNFVTLLDDAMKRQTLHRLKFLAVRVICSYLGNEGKK